MKNRILIVLLLSGFITFTSCNENKLIKESQSEQADSTKNKVFYTCPMHPEIKQNEPGKCPKCDMDLVAEEK